MMPEMTHNRNINVSFYKSFIKYEIPTYFPQEESNIAVSAKLNRWGTLEIVAYSPTNKILPLLQDNRNEFVSVKAPQLLPESPRPDISGGEGKEEMDFILPSQQGTHQATQTATQNDYYGCCPRK
jgi:hypothetical protein